VLVAFLLTPIVVHHLGSERYGMWRVLEVWLAYVGLIPQCVGQAAGFLLVPLLAARDSQRLRQFAATLAVIGGVVAALAALAGLALVPALPWVASGPEELDGERRAAFLIALLAGVPLAPLLILRCVLDADQKGYLLNGVIAVQSLTVTGVAVWLAVGGNGLPGQAVAAAAGTAAQAVLFAILAHRTYAWARPGWPTRADTHALLARASGLVLLAVLGGIAAYAEYPVVNWLYDPVETTHYSLGQRLFLVYAGLVAVIGNSIWAPAADLYHRGETDWLRVQLERALRGTAVAGAAGTVAIAAATPAFLRLWVGDGFDPGPVALSGFAVTFPLLGLNILLTWVLAATGQTRQMLLSTAVYCVVTVGAEAWLGTVLGPGGVAWGMTIGVSAAVAVNLVICGHVFGLAATRVAIRLLIVAVLGGGYGLGFAEVMRAMPNVGWLGLIGALAAGWTGFVVLGWFLVLTREDRRVLRTRLLRR
jgi:O-antigen/teichoic acid export membrane protein